MELNRLTEDVNVISKLDNYPPDDVGMTPDKLKSLFDKGSNTIKDYINNTLLPQLEQGYTGANGEGSGDMMQAVYDPTGKNTDIFGYVDNKVKTDVPAGAKFTDTVYTHPATHPASIIAQDANNRFATDTEKATWSGKWEYDEDTVKAVKVSNAVNADTVNGKTVAVNVPLGAEFSDTIYTHPDSHPASMITDLPTGRKVARFVIGTSTTGWTSDDCDYLCDGTADQTEINDAITALPATGGEIVILDGTYNIAAKINVTKHNVSIRGNGNATILKRMFNSTSTEGVITLSSRSGCKIANLQIDGNKTSYTNNKNHGIYLGNSSHITITGNTCTNSNNSYGIYLGDSSNNNTVTGNTCNNNDRGIYLGNASHSNTVTGNTCNNNNYGIYLSTSSNNNTVTGNTCNNNNYGIYLSTSSNNTVTGNTCNNNDYGIYLNDSNNSTVTGNTCIRGTGLAEDYAESQCTIQLAGTGNSYNLISNNNCMGKAVISEGGTGNTLVNNKFDAT